MDLEISRLTGFSTVMPTQSVDKLGLVEYDFFVNLTNLLVCCTLEELEATFRCMQIV
jgi:hypothetical protein